MKMRRCEDVRMFDRRPLLEEPFAQTLSGTMEKLREWKDRINRTDWSSRARCVMGREGWREERAWLGRARLFQVAAGKQRSPQGEGCRWLLMPGGEEGGAWPGVHVLGMVAAGQAR